MRKNMRHTKSNGLESSRSPQLWLFLLLFLLPILSTIPAHAQTDQQVQTKISEFQQEFLKSVSANGSWKNNVGETALILFALRESGLPAKNPVFDNGIKFLLTDIPRYAKNTYLQAYETPMAICCLLRHDPVKHKKVAETLLKGLQATQSKGGWGDNSRSQFVALAIDAAKKAGIKIDETMRKKAVKYWYDGQEKKSGGWGYTISSGKADYMAMCCAGVASLHLLGEKMETATTRCGNYKANPAFTKGLKRIEHHFKGKENSHWARSYPCYARYALERVGIFLDIKMIDGRDWYQEGVQQILAGSVAANNADKSFALLFLAKGFKPIAIAKWQWGGRDNTDWNNDHNDVRNWTKIAGKKFKTKLDWTHDKLLSLKSPAAKASMIFVNGHERFTATDDQLAFLRSFLDKDGTIVAEACCDRKAFFNSFKKVMETKLYPGKNLRFKAMAADHAALTSSYKLKPRDFQAYQLQFGCRKLRVLLLSNDISCALNGEKQLAIHRQRAERVAINLLAWSLQTKKADKRLDTVQLDHVKVEEKKTADQLVVKKSGKAENFSQAFGRLIHNGDFDADPEFFYNLNATLTKQSKGKISFDAQIKTKATDDDLFQLAMLYISGHEDPKLKKDEILNIRRYAANGGFILSSSCCSSPEFHKGFTKMVKQTFPNDKLEIIPSDDSIYLCSYQLLPKVTDTTTAYKEQYKEKRAPLYGIRRNGRWILVYSPVDLCCGIEGDLDETTIGYNQEEAFKILYNIITYALTP